MGFSLAWRAAMLAILASAAMVGAQSVVPSNASTPSLPAGVDLQLVVNHNSMQYPFGIIPENPANYAAITSVSGVNGTLLFATPDNILNATKQSVALISCDSYAGNLDATNLFLDAIKVPTTAVVFYSNTSSWCQLLNYTGSYQFAYSLQSVRDVRYLLSITNQTGAQAVSITPIPEGSTVGSGNNSTNSNANSLGPVPSTAVAMVILYAITGIITALFLAIIVTGAVRAHRHPERYGPRNGVGRPRQSRARGLAKAMLDTLPIVRFGERDDHSKPVDVETLDSSHGAVEMLPRQTGENAREQVPESSTTATSGVAAGKQPQTEEIERAGTTAEGSGAQKSPNVQETQGCSICTDDFEVGQDQRVLPCDHRFHPACIDPWLLNVSGTCPLCRIDLRPKASESLAGRSENEDELAPPLDPMMEGQNWRTNMRRSAFFSLIGTGRIDNLTQEQRLDAVRQLRSRDDARRRTDETASHLNNPEEESNIRRRLRNVFHIRTRRTGENGQSHEDTDGGAAASAEVPASGPSTNVTTQPPT